MGHRLLKKTFKICSTIGHPTKLSILIVMAIKEASSIFVKFTQPGSKALALNWALIFIL